MIARELESTGLEFATDQDLNRYYRDAHFWINRGDHPTQTMTQLKRYLTKVRRERLRRLDPNETDWSV